MATFVLEIGSEELPARFLAGEEAELAARFTAALQEASVEHGALRTMSTPRRAIVIIEDVNPVQQEREEEVAGLGIEKHEIIVKYAVGDSVRIVDGPMNSLTGVVEELDVAKNSVTVRVSMFGREMPVELELDQVEALED